MAPVSPGGRPATRVRSLVLVATSAVVVIALVTALVVLVTHRGTTPAQEEMAVESSAGQLMMSSRLGSSTVQIEATLRNSATNGAFNLVRTLLDGTVIHRTSDDVSPIRTSLGTLGGNHGFSHVAAFTNPDGKTTADLGSVWTDGVRRYELLAVDSAGKLIVGGDYKVSGDVVVSSAVTPRRNLMPVSGAVHRGAIPRAVGATQLLPSTRAVQVGATCDGNPIGDTRQECREVKVTESYEVLDYADLYDQARAHVGTPYSSLTLQGAVRVQNDYTFYGGGAMRLRSELLALRPTLLSETGLIQSAPLAAGEGRSVIRQVPGVKPIQGVDFRRGVDLHGYNRNLHVTSSDLMQTQKPPTFALDRLVENGRTKVGFSIGYVPTGAHAGSQAARADAGGTDFWDLRATDKSYPVALTSRHLNQGDSLTVEGFRTYLSADVADKVATDIADGATDGCPRPDLC